MIVTLNTTLMVIVFAGVSWGASPWPSIPPLRRP